jgi:hypothetical protein
MPQQRCPNAIRSVVLSAVVFRHLNISILHPDKIDDHDREDIAAIRYRRRSERCPDFHPD